MIPLFSMDLTPQNWAAFFLIFLFIYLFLIPLLGFGCSEKSFSGFLSVTIKLTGAYYTTLCQVKSQMFNIT